jgi:hypothetical protein
MKKEKRKLDFKAIEKARENYYNSQKESWFKDFFWPLKSRQKKALDKWTAVFEKNWRIFLEKRNITDILLLLDSAPTNQRSMIIRELISVVNQHPIVGKKCLEKLNHLFSGAEKDLLSKNWNKASELFINKNQNNPIILVNHSEDLSDEYHEIALNMASETILREFKSKGNDYLRNIFHYLKLPGMLRQEVIEQFVKMIRNRKESGNIIRKISLTKDLGEKQPSCHVDYQKTLEIKEIWDTISLQRIVAAKDLDEMKALIRTSPPRLLTKNFLKEGDIVPTLISYIFDYDTGKKAYEIAYAEFGREGLATALVLNRWSCFLINELLTDKYDQKYWQHIWEILPPGKERKEIERKINEQMKRLLQRRYSMQ